MTIQTLINVAVILVLVGWIGIRQLAWRPVEVARMWRMPLILGVVGVITVSSDTSAALTTLDITLLVIELAVSLGIGALMGSIARFRPISAAAKAAHFAKNPKDTTDVTLESSTGGWGLGLWIAFIVVRVGIDIWAGAVGSTIAASTGVILIMVAANRFSRTAVFAARTSRVAVIHS
ncbi:hypothetical protein [Glaciihabitans sp. dw_435]|uniref:hypothetical protein n=1 Tax=Glaciihabitans sp. dw_435 TaxID=2720081 RepID=UPI001BD6B17F|nr:hypothetical protein [Glaciihabitans sp. dw_435]